MGVATRRVVITGDDLGKSGDNNVGIFDAHQHGILTTASLMVGGDEVKEAVNVAKRVPSLAVGLHVNMSDTRPVLPPEQVSLLVQSDGRFPADDQAHKAALKTRTGRKQVKAEIAAQFEAFRKTGLAWDHVNTHRHIHRHPLLIWMLCHFTAKYGVPTVRIPWDSAPDLGRRARNIYLRRVCAWYGLDMPDRSIGRDWTSRNLADLLRTLPAGSSEIYFHPGDPLFPADRQILTDDAIKHAMTEVSAYTGLRELCHYRRLRQ